VRALLFGEPMCLPAGERQGGQERNHERPHAKASSV
jgi:hypothetical protein